MRIPLVIAAALALSFTTQAFAADNGACRNLQADILSRDKRIYDSTDPTMFKIRDALDKATALEDRLRCYAEVINQLGSVNRDRNEEEPTEALMYATSGFEIEIINVLYRNNGSEQSEEGKALLRKALPELIDLNGVHLLAYGVQSSNQSIRKYSFGVLSWILSNRNLCVIYDHVDMHTWKKTAYGRKGVSNLLSLAGLHAPYANKENHARIADLIQRAVDAKFSTWRDLTDPANVLRSLRERHEYQNKLEKPAKAESNPEIEKACADYKRLR